MHILVFLDPLLVNFSVRLDRLLLFSFIFAFGNAQLIVIRDLGRRQKVLHLIVVELHHPRVILIIKLLLVNLYALLLRRSHLIIIVTQRLNQLRILDSSSLLCKESNRWQQVEDYEA